MKALACGLLVLGALVTLATAADGPKQSAPPQLAQGCLESIKPILPIKPASCYGTWTQVLVCTPQCQCQWQAVCLQ